MPRGSSRSRSPWRAGCAAGRRRAGHAIGGAGTTSELAPRLRRCENGRVMLTSITLANFRSFGKSVTVPLEPISVLVGPNNSGKSAFMSVGEFVHQCMLQACRQAIENVGGADSLFHRPALGDGNLVVGWAAAGGSYVTAMTRLGQSVPRTEKLTLGQELTQGAGHENDPMEVLRGNLSSAEWLVRPLDRSRLVKLSLEKLRADSQVARDDRLASDGEGLAGAVTRWRSFEVDKAERLDEFLRGCLPEVKRVLAAADARPGFQRVWIEQTDGTRFDAEHTSDGVLFFIALAMHVLDAPRDAVVFIDEPENSIHPRRLVDLVELLRKAVLEVGCQFVLATHSTILLREFRSEPEAVLLFRRGLEGTDVTALSELPKLVGALEDSHPGDLLADGFFNNPL